MLATRDHFGKVLLDMAPSYPEVVVVNCDLGVATRTFGFKDRFRERFIECGISEANAVSIASGLSQEGFRPIVCSFGHFLTGKFLEIFQSIGLNDASVILVGTHAGLAIGKDGPTQMGLRDVALMRLLPNLRVVHPVDGIETREALKFALSCRSPVYLRLCRQPGPEIHREDYQFRFGTIDKLATGRHLALLSQGGTVVSAWEACRKLREAGYEVGLFNLSSLPVPDEEIVRSLCHVERVLIIEDHFEKGGITDEVCTALCRARLNPQVKTLAVSDYAQAAAPEDLYKRYRLDSDGIYHTSLELLNSDWRETASH